LLREFAIKSVFADPGAVELPHNESILFNKIANGLVSALDFLEPLMLVNVPLNDFFLGIQNLLKPFATAEHSNYPLWANMLTHGTLDHITITNATNSSTGPHPPSPFPSPPGWGRGLPASGGAKGDQGRGKGAEWQGTSFTRIVYATTLSGLRQRGKTNFGPASILRIKRKINSFPLLLITSKALDASRRSRSERGRRGATTEAYI
jgi:hypothetical protein